MNTIPEICMQYTQVFTTLKLELLVALVSGVIVGYWMRKLGE